MSAAKKLELTPDEQFLQDALSQGRATKQEVSMKAIGTPDVALQARVQHLDLDHCRRLERAMEATGSLSPVVIFRDSKSNKLYLADGHHRHHVYKNLKKPAIPAYVIDSDAASLEALEFATMCNREMCLGRNPEDIRKAIEMLLANELWWNRADGWIAKHVGCSGRTVTTLRSRFAIKIGKTIPDHVDTSTGKVYPRKRTPLDPEKRSITSYEKKGRTVYTGNFNGKCIQRRSPEEVRAEFYKLNDTSLEQKKDLAYTNVSATLGCYGFKGLTKNISNRYSGILGLYRPGMVILPCDFANPKTLPVIIGHLLASKEVLPLVVGQLVAARQLKDRTARMIVLCYVEDGPFWLIDLYKQAGFEFMTPEALIEELQKNEKTEPPAKES